MGKKNKGHYQDFSDENKNQKGVPEGTQEGLDEYIRVSRPSVIVVVISLLIVLVAVIVWGFVGTLPVTETVTGLVVDMADYALYEQQQAEKKGEGPEAGTQLDEELLRDEGEILIFCFLDASRYNGQAIKAFGEKAILQMPDQEVFQGKIETRVLAPISMDEAKDILFDNEWVTEQCVQQNYNWWLIIRPTEDISDYVYTLSQVTLLTEEVAPISFLMN